MPPRRRNQSQVNLSPPPVRSPSPNLQRRIEELEEQLAQTTVDCESMHVDIVQGEKTLKDFILQIRGGEEGDLDEWEADLEELSKELGKEIGKLLQIRDGKPTTTEIAIQTEGLMKVEVQTQTSPSLSPKKKGRVGWLQLHTGNLAIFSPVNLTDKIKDTIAKTGNGNVGYLITPDIEHHLFLGLWKAAYPSAKVLGVESLPEKRAKQKDLESVSFDYIFARETQEEVITSLPDEIKQEFDFFYFPDHPNKELALLHKADGGTLIEADLLFNHPPSEQYSESPIGPTQGVLTKLFQCFTYIEGNGQRRFWWHMANIKDRQAFAKCVKYISQNWEFERIIPCHGDVIENNGKDAWNKAMKWYLDLPDKSQARENSNET